MNTTEIAIGTRVRPITTSDYGPGVITHTGPGAAPAWVTVRHDNGASLEWLTWALEVIV